MKVYPKTQFVFATNSGESEVYGVVSASTEAFGVSTPFDDFGMSGVKVRAEAGVEQDQARLSIFYSDTRATRKTSTSSQEGSWTLDSIRHDDESFPLRSATS